MTLNWHSYGHADLHAFADEGLACVRALPVGGAPRQITAKQLAQIWQWAECSPRELGLLGAPWTLVSFRTFLVKRQHVLKPDLGIDAASGPLCFDDTEYQKPISVTWVRNSDEDLTWTSAIYQGICWARSIPSYEAFRFELWILGT